MHCLTISWVDQYLANGIAPSTKRVYEAEINKYVKLCREHKQPY